jgi:D-3-phosphoglycerate dehydrogenase
MTPRIILVGGAYAIKSEPWRNQATDNLQFIDYSSYVADPKSDFQEVIGLWVELLPQITNEIIEKFPSLKFVATSTTGVTHLDLNALTARSVQVLSLDSSTDFMDEITSTAELTWLLTMAVWRKLLHNLAKDHVLDINAVRYRNLARELRGKTLGIIGFGRVGKQISKYSKAFQMNVQAFDPYVSKDIFIKHIVKESDSIEKLVASSDIIVLSAKKNFDNSVLLGQKQISFVKKDAIVINTSRGSLWDERIIANYLLDGLIGGVGVDVYSEEELINSSGMSSALLSLDENKYNIVRTPHIAGATSDALDSVTNFMYRKIVSFIGTT